MPDVGFSVFTGNRHYLTVVVDVVGVPNSPAGSLWDQGVEVGHLTVLVEEGTVGIELTLQIRMAHDLSGVVYAHTFAIAVPLQGAKILHLAVIVEESTPFGYAGLLVPVAVIRIPDDLTGGIYVIS